MKPQQIKNAFARINEEAGKDESLGRAVASRAGTEKIAVPTQAVKALLKQFLNIETTVTKVAHSKYQVSIEGK